MFRRSFRSSSFLLPAVITSISSKQILSSQYCLSSSTQFLLQFQHPLLNNQIRFCHSSPQEGQDQQEGQEQPNNDKGDYYKVESLEDATPPEKFIEWRSSRGSGPGGQAVNVSQNKAELRVQLQKWHMEDPFILDPETYQKIERDHSKKITKDGVLILTSHMHRSLEKNREECLNGVRKIVRDASYVPPALNPTMKFDPNYVKRVVMPKKRMKSNFNKMKRQARSGSF